MSELQPDNTDAILGGQNPPPVDAAVLGGVAGEKQKLDRKSGLIHKLLTFETVTVDEHGEIINCNQKQMFYYTENLGNEVTLDMIHIPAGNFMMGLPEDQGSRRDSGRQQQTPQHLVTLDAFYIGAVPITQMQYQSIMGENPAHFRGNNRPVETVPWHKAKEFCQKLSSKTGKRYRLPSESQWEYACKSGTKTLFHFGDTITPDLVNYKGSSHGRKIDRNETTEVSQFPPNAFGLYDMHGNVAEWCEDTWHYNYEGAPTDGNPWVDDCPNPNVNFSDYYYHVLRGGSWLSGYMGCHSASRLTGSQVPHLVGFRVVCLHSP